MRFIARRANRILPRSFGSSLILERDRGSEQTLLLRMKAGGGAPLPSPGPWVAPNRSHEESELFPSRMYRDFFWVASVTSHNSRSRGMLP